MSDVDFERLQAFADETSPPQRKVTAKNTVPAINNGTIYWGAGLVGAAIVFMIVTRVISGNSFAGDLLILGSMGVMVCGIIFCLSALGAYFLRKHQHGTAKTEPGWVAAQVVDRQFDASIETGGDFVFLELLDGRRVRLQPVSANAKATKAGDIGWVLYKNNQLIEFAPE